MAFAKCLNTDHAAIKQQGNSFVIDGSASGKPQQFHDCDHIVALYEQSGMKDGKLEKQGSGFKFTPLPADLPEWSAAVKKAHSKRAAMFMAEEDLF